jgi:hypothetical protein
MFGLEKISSEERTNTVIWVQLMQEHEVWRLKLKFLHLNIYTLLHKESTSSGFSESIPHRISPLFSVQPQLLLKFQASLMESELIT